MGLVVGFCVCVFFGLLYILTHFMLVIKVYSCNCVAVFFTDPRDTY